FSPGSSEVVGPADPVVALAGDDVILPCFLKPSVSAEDMVVKWTRLNLKAENVHLYLDGRDSNEEQHPSYRGRTSMFHEELKNGNVSLKLTNVTLSDAGGYRCFLPTLTSQVKETTVQLLVGAVSQPVISIDGTKGWGVVLKCESGGWSPEPVMEWLDSSGTILPADGPPERHRDSEDLYALRRYVTVNKTDTNRFTCRVNQTEINHLKETEIHVPDDVFPKSQVGLIVGLSIAAAAVVVLASSAGVYKLIKYTGDARFVNIHSYYLIQNVTMVIPIAFYLIRSETYSKIRAARTSQDQMELLYEALDFGGNKVKSDFYRILLDLEPDLVIDQGALFVDVHKDHLIQMVTQVKPIMYEMFYAKLYCNIRINLMTSRDQMKQLYQALEEASHDTGRVKLDFYRILLDLEPDLVRDLGKNLSTSGYISLEYKPYLVYHLGKNLSTSGYISLEYKPYLVYHLGKNRSTSGYISLEYKPYLVYHLGKNLSTSGYISLEYKPYLVYHLGKNLSTSGYISLEYKPYLVYHLGKNLSTSGYISLEYKPYLVYHLGKNLSTSGYISLEYKPYLVYHLGKNLSTSGYISLEYKPYLVYHLGKNLSISGYISLEYKPYLVYHLEMFRNQIGSLLDLLGSLLDQLGSLLDRLGSLLDRLGSLLDLLGSLLDLLGSLLDLLGSLLDRLGSLLDRLGCLLDRLGCLLDLLGSLLDLLGSLLDLLGSLLDLLGCLLDLLGSLLDLLGSLLDLLGCLLDLLGSLLDLLGSLVDQIGSLHYGLLELRGS
ncbi:selection and upkeep of intraepithelial T-cells protein 6-like, partial [Salvelinus fontinalis]|uniref:selection and upkeep of intraepithelial T-cells protein 6-like n=1 Tax=Salvelinus fontinalis TaxID=8038 RepID=UPI0024855FE1